MPAGGFGNRQLQTDSRWAEQYRRYQRDCAAWELPTQSFADFKAYWEMFAKDGELQNTVAPTMVQRS